MSLQSDQEIINRIALSRLPGLHYDHAVTFLDKVGSEQAFFDADARQLQLLTGLPAAKVGDAARLRMLQQARDELRFVKRNGLHCLYFNDSGYPRRLTMCPDAPALLYALGDTDLDAAHIVSIVGTRHATAYGVQMTTRIVEELAGRLDNLVIVSGLAFGIDVTAHQAALKAGVPTVAVTAHPLNTVYPAVHRPVAKRMIDNGGAMVSEYATCDTVTRGNFLARNRIIAALADATIVVESDSHGGALVTARLALDYSRTVFAVPGRVTDRFSTGCNTLIARQAARPYTGADDFISEMGWKARQPEATQQSLFDEPLHPDQLKVLEFIRLNPQCSDTDIKFGTAMNERQAKNAIFALVMDQLIQELPGKRYNAL